MMNAFLLTVTSVFVAMQLNFWTIRWTDRFLYWWHTPRCAICKDKCHQYTIAPGPDGNIRITPLCLHHFRESMEMHRRQAEQEAGDNEGEEWKNR